MTITESLKKEFDNLNEKVYSGMPTAGDYKRHFVVENSLLDLDPTLMASMGY